MMVTNKIIKTKIVGITRLRNEEKIIKHTLDHVASIGVSSVYVYDDCSSDNTVDICRAHPIVKEVILGEKWEDTSRGRDVAEGWTRQKPYAACLKENPDYVYCFDADELADFSQIDFEHDNYRLRLFDFYITEKDVDKEWYTREYMGPEYRDVLMLFKPTNRIHFLQREPRNVGGTTRIQGEVKHFGKAISIEEWEATCDYYIKYFPRYPRWKARKGKAIHRISDFGRPLIKWGDRYSAPTYKIR